MRQQQQDYSLKMNKEVLSYAEEQQKKKRDIIERNQKHQQDVKTQIEERSKLLQFIGSSILTE